ncbi:AAA family ATPase [Wenzhouxiangella sp. XN201]|uniref:ATP-binding protein n=1 Tax=Wenzhouxiangella sp. XN201 TaxID=2710755 RepID=UPI0013CBDCE9|nr:ATP-binding protein [Wenzhouxiangella sp. XN201]NEZ02801.1 AAA family ATPase [Wenzhouxiangella sp. XN201]
MKWYEEKLQQLRTRKLHHRTYKKALSNLQTELTFSEPGEVVVLTGPSRAGKTSVLERLEREYLESSGNDSSIEHPFVYVEAENKAQEGRFSSKAFFSDLAEALNHPAFSAHVEDGRHRAQNVSRTDRRTTADLMTACERALRHLKSRYLAIDEAQHIQWHGSSPRARTAILDSFKSFASNANVTLVLTGAYPIVGMLRASNHMVGRSSLLEMPRYHATPEDADDFMGILDWYSKGIQFERGVGSLIDWAGYIHEHSLGVVGAVGRWLRIAMAKMVSDGSEVLAWKYMDEARRNDGDLASIAAEIRLGEELLNKTPVKEPVVWSEQAKEWGPASQVEEAEPKRKRRKLKPFEIRNRVYKKKFNK